MLDSAFVSYVTVMSITPGPNNLLLAASGVNFGLRRTFPMMLGITFGCALQCALMTTLLAFILSWVGVVRLPLVTLGGGYLLWLSWKIFNSGTPNARDSEQPMGFIQGALFQAINPKAWLMAMNVAILFTPSRRGDAQPYPADYDRLCIVKSALRRCLGSDGGSIAPCAARQLEAAVI